MRTVLLALLATACSTPLQKAYRGGTMSPSDEFVTVTSVENLDTAVQTSQREGYVVLGESTFPGKGDVDVNTMAREQAHRIGATLVLVKITPAGKEVTRTTAQVQTDDGNAATMLQGQAGLSMTNTLPTQTVYMEKTVEKAIYEVKFLVQPK
jgi:hypothetical protein